MPDDGKLDTESDSGEFWVLFGGFAPIGKKVVAEDDVIPEVTPAKLYRYSHLLASKPDCKHISNNSLFLSHTHKHTAQACLLVGTCRCKYSVDADL